MIVSIPPQVPLANQVNVEYYDAYGKQIGEKQQEEQKRHELFFLKSHAVETNMPHGEFPQLASDAATLSFSMLLVA